METDMNIKGLILVAAMALVSLAGCGGSHTTKVQGTTTVSKGQELQDLQRALNEGAITQDEYDRVRKVILKRSN
jgi:hypothetical protein